MKFLHGLSLSEAGLLIFAAGLALGMVLSLGFSVWLGRRRTARAILRRVDALEWRLASMKDESALLQHVQNLQSALPHMNIARVSSAYSANVRPVYAKPVLDVETLIRGLVESFQSNATIVVDMSTIMLKDDNWRAANPEVRGRVVAELKALARRLDVSFWDRNSGTFNSFGNHPLWGKFANFFYELKGLKSAIDSLVARPDIEALGQVLYRIAAVIKIGVAIIEEIEKLA